MKKMRAKTYLLIGGSLIVAMLVWNVEARSNFYIKASKPYNDEKITCLVPSGSIEKTIRRLGMEFSQLTGVRVNVLSKPYEKASRESTTTGQAPLLNLSLHDLVLKEFEAGSSTFDIIAINVLWTAEFMERGFLAALNSYFKSDQLIAPGYDLQDFIPQLLNYSKWEGILYGLPYQADVMLLFYRQDLLKNKLLRKAFKDKYGYNLSLPKNWEEFQKIGSFFTKSINPESPVDYGISLMGAKKYGLTFRYLNRFLPYMNKTFLNATFHPTLNSPEAIKALEMLKDNLKIARETAIKDTETETVEQLMNGKVAMSEQWASRFSEINDPFWSKVSGKVSVSILPGSKSWLGGWILGLSKYSEHKEAAFLFIEYLTNKENDVKKMMLESLGPSRKSSYDNLDLREKFPHFLPLLEECIRTSYIRSCIPEYHQLAEVMMKYLSSFLRGEKKGFFLKKVVSAKDTLSAIASEWEKILKK